MKLHKIIDRFILKNMNELDEVLQNDLEFAIAQAKESNRFEIADYLSLKESNNAIRTESINWLIDTTLEIVFAFNKHGAKIKITQNKKHNFQFGNANLRGKFLKLQQGVRCLEIEAGWTRTPSDGFMRGGALACAKLTHFGFTKMNEDLVLLTFEDKPQWFSIADERMRISFNTQSFRKHFETFLG